MRWTCNSRTESPDVSMCCPQREWWKKPMTCSATAFGHRSRAPSVRNSDGAASGTADLSEQKTYPLQTPEDIVNGCYDEAAAFLEALSGGTAKPSIAEVFPSVELCFAIAQIANEGATR